MTSKDDNKEAYVWIWLPGETKPVVAGILQRVGTRLLLIMAGATWRAKTQSPSTSQNFLSSQAKFRLRMTYRCRDRFGMHLLIAGAGAS